MTAATLDPLPLRRALADEPQRAVAWQRLGLMMAAAGDVASALTPLRRAASTAPGLPAPWENLGLAFGALGRWPEAASAYGNAFSLRSNRADLAATLADALGKAGRAGEAGAVLDRAIALSPADARLRRMRGMTRAMAGNVAGALADLMAALAAEPGDAVLHYALAQCLLRLAEIAAAERRFRSVQALDGQTVDALINLGVLVQARDGVAARRLFRRSIALDPLNAAAHGNLALVDMGLGRIDDAIRRLRRTVGFAPDAVDVHSNLLLALGYVELDADLSFAEHRRWEARHAVPAYAHIRPWSNDPDPERRLRVGYLSADFYDHALGTNLAGLIYRHDRRAVEVTCYAEIGRPDDMTRHVREISDRFVETQTLDDAALAERIRTDAIDILVVLAGHTARNRLTAAARKPAPVMVSYAEFSTSGLAVMDYWLTDPVVHPESGTEERFTEALMRIPMMVLHKPIDVSPAVSPLPARLRGHVTFGSYNNPAKIGDRVIDLWARILNQVPQSRLMLKYRKVYEVPDIRERLRGRFAGHGIDPGRIVFAGGDLDRASHLALVGEMDIALDPFPFNGCTTTFEALWMGVPVVNLAGRRWLGRMGTSFLTHLGAAELIAGTPDDYVRIAAALAGDLDRLADLRARLRERVLASPLCDDRAYAASIEKAFRTAWRRWCEGGR
jgi:predicted O-linked N-acetylglucosamine transferase (SPINDLY family)